jgi:hypothetical protein
MLSELAKVFGSRIKALEILALIDDIKPVVRQGFYSYELAAVEAFCSGHGLFLEKSPYTVVVTGGDSFSNEGKVSSDSAGMLFVYMSKNQEKALLACLAEARQDHKLVGRLLGYPPCCVQFFGSQAKRGNFNPVHQPTNPWTNLMQRGEDVVLLSHFPCCSECEKSIEIAQKNLELLKKYDVPTAELFHDKLSNYSRVNSVIGT